MHALFNSQLQDPFYNCIQVAILLGIYTLWLGRLAHCAWETLSIELSVETEHSVEMDKTRMCHYSVYGNMNDECSCTYICMYVLLTR